MKKLIVLFIIFFNLPNLYAQIDPQMTLVPLCFQDRKSCNMAAEVLSLPPYGNFRLASKCRDKTPREKQIGVCSGWNGLLGIEAFIDLPQVTQFQWRNQCYNNIFMCNDALKIWKQLVHPFGKIKFEADCGNFVRAKWQMSDKDMRARGIFNCQAPDLVELRVKAIRVSL